MAMDPSRQRLVAVVVILVLAVPLVVLAASSGGSDEDGGANLRAELFPVPPPGGEVVVYVDPADNTPERAGGRRRVTLECVDRNDGVVVQGEHAWPLTDTDGGTVDPHTHQRLRRGREDIVRCRLVGTDFEGPAQAAEL